MLKATYEAIRNSPLWNSSMLIITYDEHGGFYDSVKPGAAPTPNDGSPPGFHHQHRRLHIRSLWRQGPLNHRLPAVPERDGRPTGLRPHVRTRCLLVEPRAVRPDVDDWRALGRAGHASLQRPTAQFTIATSLNLGPAATSVTAPSRTFPQPGTERLTRFKKRRKSSARWRSVMWVITLPEATSSACRKVRGAVADVVVGQAGRCSRRIGNFGAVRLGAWTCVFSRPRTDQGQPRGSDQGAVSAFQIDPFPRPVLRTGRARFHASGSPRDRAVVLRNCLAFRPWRGDGRSPVAVAHDSDRVRFEEPCLVLRGHHPGR